MSEKSTRPTRRELRLARIAEESRRKSTDISSESTVVIPVAQSMLETAPTVDDDATKHPCVTVAQSNDSVAVAKSKNFSPQGSSIRSAYAYAREIFSRPKNLRTVTSTACVFALAVGCGLTLGSYGFEIAAQANSIESDFAGGDVEGSQTPTSLRSLSSAADSARFKAYEEKFSGNAVVCETVSSANSLTSFARNNLNKLIHPMAAGTFQESSPFGWRIHPLYGTSKLHEGVDFSAAIGTPIYAVADGKVVFSGASSETFGDPVVVIEHNIDGEVFTSWYLHSYASGIFVNEGDVVRLGDRIADVGNSGRSTGPHLHFEIHPGAYAGFTGPGPVDPMSFLKEQGAVDINDVCGVK
ncbi:M23 family metallopeptidase [Arcanobacterium phocisimile]|uniref:M23 family metallopeptidase n=1 Tax=Arcanobacterium phocisimile TaxID=1302235 RepID=A0ABX7IIZ0_9ACTO|nr:M23 family metallopeptidase [Arcanobacterium phocisimile]QRV02499.1 M23 family metallopeptidase [Arcanobacterium phocisimile]